MSTKSKSPIVAVTDVDQLTADQLTENLRQTRLHLEAIRALWPGLRRLEEKERRVSIGRNLTRLGAPLRELFTLLLPKDREAPPIASVFDVLGDQDGGDDPDHFEPALLLRRLDRAEAQSKLVDEIEALARDLADDVLATGESVILPGLLALNLARSVSKGNPAYRSALRSVLDAFRNMTKAALRGRADKQAAEAAAAPVPAAGNGK
jgi:hypothetical protein